MFPRWLQHFPSTYLKRCVLAQFVQANPDLRLERAATGELIIMAPAGSESGSYNSELTTDVTLWNRKQSLGKVFDSSSGFRLPNGAIRAPDVAWIEQSRWQALSPELASAIS